jgi:hypothetical protein
MAVVECAWWLWGVAMPCCFVLIYRFGFCVMENGKRTRFPPKMGPAKKLQRSTHAKRQLVQII